MEEKWRGGVAGSRRWAGSERGVAGESSREANALVNAFILVSSRLLVTRRGMNEDKPEELSQIWVSAF